jgi:hypothetical protein
MKKILFILLMLIALMLLMSCTKQNYSEKVNPLLDKYIEAWNTGNLSLLTNVIDPAFKLRKVPDFKPVRGITNLENYINTTRAVVPDFFIKENEKLFISDTAVVITWTVKGTYKGESNLPPTGNKLNISGFSIIYFSGDKLTGEWIAYSDLTWTKQLGFNIVPPSVDSKKNK